MREIGEAEIFEYCGPGLGPELELFFFLFFFFFWAAGNHVAMAMAMAMAMAKLGDDLRSLKIFSALRANLTFLQPRGYGYMHGNCYGWPLEV